MMNSSINIGRLHCLCCRQSDRRIAYILYPMDMLSGWIEEAARKFDVSIVVLTGMDWDDDLTPWPAPGVPTGCSDFKGLAPRFLEQLQSTVIPEVEKRLQIQPTERDLIGVSLSGLFTLWQWAECDTFRNIASLSGSFWYQGFTGWLGQHCPKGKQGVAYFLLGELEHKSNVPQFRGIDKDTSDIIDSLRKNGIPVKFEMVPGNHYQFGIDRLNRAFSFLYPAAP